MSEVCELESLDAKLECKLKSLAKHHKIAEELREQVRDIEVRKRSIYFRMMDGKGVY